MFIIKFLRAFPQVQQKYNYIHKYIYKMDKAYMRYTEGSDVFELSFLYFNPNLNVNRQFNFSRKLTENVNAFLTRVSTNVEKALNKKQKKKKSEHSEDANTLLQQIILLRDGKQVDGEMLCQDLFKIGGDLRLKLLDQEYSVVINTPWIKNITLPTCMLANFPVYPAKFETLFVDKTLSDFTWYKSHDQKNWTIVGSGFLYTPSIDVINHFLKLDCLPKNRSDIGPHTETISTNKVEANPGLCPFEQRHQFTKEKLSGKNFRVVTYNILADLYVDTEYSRTVLYPYCPPYALNIDYRKQLILKELIGYNADIICLQEVDDKVFDNDLYPVLSTIGFDGIFNKKGGTVREGVACFYNTSRFKLIDSTCVTLAEEVEKSPLFSELWAKISKNENLVKRLTERTTSVQMTVLDSVENDEILLVANTHLYFHPDADHIRLLQAGMASIYIEDMVKTLKEDNKEKEVSVIFCGDFNTVPECGIYKLFTTGNCPEDFIDWKSNEQEAVVGVSLSNPRLMLSACGTPKYTNFTSGFQDCLDYIFYEKSSFEVTQVIPLPSDSELTAHTALPSVVFPSDHVSLVADLKWL